jgi:hypothetical protein
MCIIQSCFQLFRMYDIHTYICDMTKYLYLSCFQLNYMCHMLSSPLHISIRLRYTIGSNWERNFCVQFWYMYLMGHVWAVVCPIHSGYQLWQIYIMELGLITLCKW